MNIKHQATLAIKKSFPGEHIFFSIADIPTESKIPFGWQGFGIKDDLTEHAWYPSDWIIFSSRLPWLTSALEKSLIGTAIILSEKKPCLIYVFSDNEDFYFYVGNPPLDYFQSHSIDHLENLPDDLMDFYRKLHNGFTFHPSKSMGPLPLENQPRLCTKNTGVGSAACKRV